MSKSKSPQRSKGNIIILAGIAIIICAVLISLDLLSTNTAVSQSESSSVLGAVSAMAADFNRWLEWLLRSMIVNIIALLLAGGTFIYAGIAIKDAEAIALANQQGIDPEEINSGSVTDSFRDITKILTSDSRYLNSEFQVGGVGAFFGLIFALIMNATLAGSLFWMVLFASLSWSILTPTGQRKRKEVQDHLRAILQRDGDSGMAISEDQADTYNCPHCGAKNESTRKTCRSCEVTLTTVDD